jgi:putative serine protease PepD
MTGGGPYPSGDGPEDPEPPHHEDGSEDEGTGEVSGFHGWVPPQERSWRHPSELFASSGPDARNPGGASGSQTPRPDATGADTGPGGPGGSPSRPGRTRSRPSRRTWATVLLGSGIAAAVVTGGFVLATSVNQGGGSDGAARTSSATLPNPITNQIAPPALSSLANALVLISVTGPTGTVVRSGIAIAADGLVATTAAGLAGADILTVTTSDGQEMPATMIAVDPGSDVAVVRVPTSLAVPRFADDGGLNSGERLVGMAVSPTSGPMVIRASWSWVTLETLTTATTGSGGMATIAAVPGTSGSSTSDNILVDSSGRVVGIRDQDVSPTSGTTREVFLPSQLVLGVAHDLVTSGQVVHGWLGVSCRDGVPKGSDPSSQGSSSGTTGTAGKSNKNGSDGALVVKLQPHSPATNELHAGDVITSVDGAPVRSTAELKTRLYVLDPGTSVHLEVVRHGRERPVDVALGSSP